MIAGVKGVLGGKGPDWLEVEVGGVTLRLLASASAVAEAGAPGDAVRLHTYLHVREDELTLYGFAFREERELFLMLIGVAGVGPKTALGMLSAGSPSEIASAIASEDVSALTRLPGVGKKTAQRLILELKGQMEREWALVAGVGAPAQGDAEVAAALMALGYSASEARSALAEAGERPGLPVEERVRLALQRLGSR